jgi:hypothetical protein
MKLTKESNELISFFVKNDCLKTKQTKKTDAILKNVYDEIKEGVSYVNTIKAKMGNVFYKLTVKQITNKAQIIWPVTFYTDAFKPEVKKHIYENSNGLLTYKFNMFDRIITIIFVIEEKNMNGLIETYNKYIDYMLVWLYIANIHSSKKCVKQLKIFIYHTSLLKQLPKTNMQILNQNNANTGFCMSCPVDSEIVVFRKEEWFKVFIHETFHNFGLDFSSMNVSLYNKKILQIFPVNSEVNLFESYTEFWGRIINASFCSFINMKNKNDIDEFYSNTEFFINLEKNFAFFQMIKILDFMGLSYIDLYRKTLVSENTRNTQYKENTNILSYYVLTTILLNNYQDFLSWCDTNNISLLDFKKTPTHINNFCAFIEKKYKTKNMLDGIKCIEKIFYNIKNKNKIYLLENLRMTICEVL